MILIIGILAAIAIPSFLNWKNKANDAAAKAQASPTGIHGPGGSRLAPISFPSRGAHRPIPELCSEPP